jgi:hypothetical protein
MSAVASAMSFDECSWPVVVRTAGVDGRLDHLAHGEVRRARVASGFAGSGTLTSSTPLAKVALTSSSLTPSGSGTAR